MFVQYLLLTLVLIFENHCDDHFIRYKSKEIPCSNFSTDHLWIQCTINQSNPLKFSSKTPWANLKIEFLLLSVENLTLPSKFFVNDNDPTFPNYDLIRFETTRNARLKQINIFAETFSNLPSAKIDFFLHDCGYPILEMERNIFHSNVIHEIFIIYHNRSRMVRLKDYFLEECLIEEDIVFKNENQTNLILATRSPSLVRRKRLHLINGSLFGIVILLTGMMMCLINRKITSSSYDIIQTSRTPSEFSTTVRSHVS